VEEGEVLLEGGREGRVKVEGGKRLEAVPVLRKGPHLLPFR
jgi:hypothetical protein